MENNQEITFIDATTKETLEKLVEMFQQDRGLFRRAILEEIIPALKQGGNYEISANQIFNGLIMLGILTKEEVDEIKQLSEQKI